MNSGGQAERETNVVEIASRLLLRHHVDAWAALGMARLTPAEEAVLRLYALQDWSQWRRLRPLVIAGMAPRWYADQAAADGMSRILWARADVPVERRARELGVRSLDFRRAVREAETMLRSWLHVAAIGYLVALSRRDGFTPASRHTDPVDMACPPTRPRAVPRHGQLPIQWAA